MPSPFDSARRCIEHSDWLTEELARQVQAFLKDGPYSIFRRDDPDHPTHYIFYAKLTKEIPVRIPGLARDAIANLRAALDHLGYEVAVASGKSGQAANFPFGSNPDDACDPKKSRSKDIPPEIRRVMLSFRPYKGGDASLWALHVLNNVAKHESFVRTALLTSQVIYQKPGMYLAKPLSAEELSEKYIPLTWQRKTDPEFPWELELNTAIRFTDVRDIRFMEPAIATLGECRQKVERIVDAVEIEARRLGLIG